jgi:GT2 family glycosyltransferase
VPSKVYVIIINWNGERDTIECLASLTHVAYDDMHVVISDNGSRPESLRALREWAKSAGLALSSPDASPLANASSPIRTLCLIENGRNLGFTGANSTGIRYAMEHGAQFVMFLNNDTQVTESFLSRMVSVAESDPACGIVGCKTLLSGSGGPDGTRRIWSLGGYEYIFGNPMNLGRNQLDRPEWNGVWTNDLVCGCCMLIRREVVETVGVQDDTLFFGIDDVEYSLRAARYGWKNKLALDAEIYHEGSQSVEGRTGLQLYYLFRNTYYFRAKYFPWYRNLVFFTHHLTRYFIMGGAARLVLGRGRANVGMVLGIYDFLRARMGECSHPKLLQRKVASA